MDNPFSVEDKLEQALCKEIAAEQVVHVPLSEYAIGSPRYERLHEAMQTASRFSWSLEGQVNV